MSNHNEVVFLVTRQTIVYPDFTFSFRRRPFPTLFESRLLTYLQQHMGLTGLPEPRHSLPPRPPKLSVLEDDQLYGNQVD